MGALEQAALAAIISDRVFSKTARALRCSSRLLHHSAPAVEDSGMRRCILDRHGLLAAARRTAERDGLPGPG